MNRTKERQTAEFAVVGADAEDLYAKARKAGRKFFGHNDFDLLFDAAEVHVQTYLEGIKLWRQTATAVERGRTEA